VSDFDGDGRIDLVVTQNAAETRLFRNVRAKQVCVCDLKGHPETRSGMEPKCVSNMATTLGQCVKYTPAEVMVQDSPVQVLTGGDGPLQVWVRWPGGKSFTVDVPPVQPKL